MFSKYCLSPMRPRNHFHSKINFNTFDKFSEKAYYVEDNGKIGRQTGYILISNQASTASPFPTHQAYSVGLKEIDQMKYYGKSTSCFLNSVDKLLSLKDNKTKQRFFCISSCGCLLFEFSRK